MLLVAVAVGSAACSSPPPIPSAPPRLLRSEDLTPAERLYGIGPKRSPLVTYQPDVILVERGAAAIRGVSLDGLTWTLDASAVRERDVQPGKVLFVTGRAVGRVLGVRRANGELAVTLGPVAITDVIRDAHIELRQLPIDFGRAIQHEAPEFPGTTTAVTPIAFNGSTPIPRIRRVAAGPSGVGALKGIPIVSPGRLGMRVVNDGELKLIGQGYLKLSTPRLDFVFIAAKGTILRAEVVLSGTAGLTMEFESGSETGSGANINRRFVAPVDLSIPISGLGVPLSVVVTQAFVVKTAFSAKGVMTAKGDYEFTGGMHLGYREGKFDVGGPAVATNESLLRSTEGVSMGPTGLVLIHQVRILVGLGAFGFATGPFVQLDSSVAVYRHADLDVLLRCTGAQLVIDMAAGIGYVIPEPVADVINFFLKALNVRQIARQGGMETPPLRLTTLKAFKPQLPGCSHQ